MNVHLSQFATNLRCPHCSQSCSSSNWPLNGDHVPFYTQKMAAAFSVPVSCSGCGKDWHVVWDENPGPVTPLFTAGKTAPLSPSPVRCWFCQQSDADPLKPLVVTFEHYQTPDVKVNVPRCEACSLIHETEKKTHRKLGFILAIILTPIGYYLPEFVGGAKWPLLSKIFLFLAFPICGYFLAAIVRLGFPTGRLRMMHIDRLISFPGYKEQESHRDRKATHTNW
jgi:hypothetical protein